MPAQGELAPPKFHYEWNDILINSKSHFCVEAFRESGKSQLVIRGHTIYRLVYPSIDYDYILLILANQRTASKKLKEIADEYCSDPILSANLVRVKEQSEKAFCAEVLDVHGNIVEVRIEAYGKGSAIRGLSYRNSRPKLVVMDDCQDSESAQSETTCDKDWEWFQSDVMFLGQNTRIFMIANNLGERCLIERTIANAKSLKFEWARIPILGDEGKSNWEEKYSPAFIEEEREAYATMGSIDVWFRERMCIAISPENQRFKKEMLTNRYEKVAKDLSVYITVDLAISQKLTADYTAICVVGVNSENHWFILDIIYGRFDVTRTIDEIFKAVVKYKPIKVGIEKVGYQASLEEYLKKEMPRKNIFFSIDGLSHGGNKKEYRIEALQPRFSAGTVWLPEKAEWLTEFTSEILAFPRGNHDDLIDALAYMEKIAYAPSGGWGKVATKDLPMAGEM